MDYFKLSHYKNNYTMGFGSKSKAITILSVFVEKGKVLWLREEGKRIMSPDFG